jgi:NAD(P)-dependent dehydrogenase (short-subunit alcohol dehydrogenase family)
MTAKDFSLQGKIALVTGDSKFWAKPIAVALASAGADVAIAAKNSPKLTEVVEAVKGLKKKSKSYPTDITKPQQIQKTVQQAIADFGKIDILVNSADIQFFQPFTETTDSDWQKVQEYNLNSAVHFCRAVGKQMLSQQKGRIINVISCLAERGIVNGAAYCVSMGGVLELTRALALEWADKGITVNAISTGWFTTPDKQLLDENQLRYFPLKRYGNPDEIGSLVVYLASNTTDFVTGHIMYADGALMTHA